MNSRALWTATLGLLLATALGAALAGCGGGKTPSGSHRATSSTHTTSTQTKPKQGSGGSY
jgi:hypothetical protein